MNEQTKNTAADIIDYLKDRGIYAAFATNLTAFRKDSIDIADTSLFIGSIIAESAVVERYLDRLNAVFYLGDALMSAFIFDETPEGEDFRKAENEAFLKWFNA